MGPGADSATAEILQRRAAQLTAKLLASAARHFDAKLVQPAIRFDLRGKSAGQVRTEDGRRCTIRYNPSLLERHPEEFLARTIPHETAHVVAFNMFGPRVQPHGREWQAIMGLFDASPERCHRYDVQGLQTRRLRRYRYRCDCCTHELTSIRHNRIGSGQVYYCRKCGSPLQRVLEGSLD